MGYFILNDIKNLADTLEKRIHVLSDEKPYINTIGAVLLIKCKNKEERNKLLTELIYKGYELKGISSKNSLWIKLTETDVYLETTKSLFVECKKPNYDEIYIHKNDRPSKKFVNMLKENNVRYKHIKPFCFFDEHIAYTNKTKTSDDNKEMSEKVIPEALKGLEVSEDLHSFTYKYGTDNKEGKIEFYTSDKIDRDKLEELIRKCF